MSKETMKLALEALEGLEALLLSMGLTHLIVYGDAEKAITNLQKALANEALDKMAENAKELGLDYDVKSDHRLMDMPAQQEPVGEVVLEGLIGDSQVVRFHMYKEIPPVGAKLYTAPPQSQPLTDEQIEREWQFLHDEEGNPPDHHEFARAIEAAHGIKENT